jgi:O-antigen/teichoic acid export membrane protein
MGRSYLTVVVCQAIAAVAAVSALRWLAIYVEPEVFGRYTLYQSVVSAIGLFLISWPNAALLRFGREEWVRQGSVGATLGARCALFATSVAAAVALVWWFDPWVRTLLGIAAPGPSPWRWIALGIVVVPASELAIYVSQAVGRTEMYGYSPLITRAGFLAGVMLIPLIRPAAEWTYLAGCLILSSVAASVYAFGTMPRAAWRGFEIRPRTVMILVTFSWTLPFAGISTYVVNWVDSWVIREVKGVALVGIYNWAYQATAIAGLAFAPIAVILTPRVIDARLKQDSIRIARYVEAILPAAGVMALATTALLWLAFPLLQRFIAPAYAPAYPIIMVLLAALPAQLINYLVTPLANAYEQLLPRIVLVSVAIAVLNVVGDLLLVPRIGILGAAIATLSAFTIGSLLLIIVIGSSGIKFAPVWRYSVPTLSLVPTLILLQWNALSKTAALAAGAAVLGLMLLHVRGVIRASRDELRSGAITRAVTRLVRALTLSEMAVTDVAVGTQPK